jgi:hyaluronan synthase
VIALFAAKIVLSWKPPPVIPQHLAVSSAGGVRVGVAVTVYNEDPDLLGACLGSLLAQSYLLERVVVIDDCSPDRGALTEAVSWRDRFCEAGIDLVVERFAVNQGKRHALMRALELQPDIDALLGVDSDTVVAPDAVANLVRSYTQPDVKVVTGLVLALNFDRNLLTRLIDLRYAQAFLVDRGAQSRFGQVLCACGSLTLYSAQVLRKYRPDFLNQLFLGKPAVFGDDRRLTNYCLLEGRALFNQSAVAWTAVPEKMSHFLRQQVRWNKSFFRESLWVLRAMPIRKPAFWFTFIELAGWIIFTGTLIFALVVAPLVTAQLLIGPYLLYLALMAYGRSFRYPDLTGVRPKTKDRLIGFAIAPIYGLLHVGVLVWLRIYALVTLRRSNWGTRSSVEVTLNRPSPNASSVPAQNLPVQASTSA